MIGKRFYLLILWIVIFIFPYYAYGKTMNVYSINDLMKASQVSDITIVVRKHINLNKIEINLAPSCELRFRGGSLRNGILVGNQTKLNAVRWNCFHDCTINGTWKAGCVYSTMFDEDQETLALMRNMSNISSVLRFSANRVYNIDAQDESIKSEIIESDGKVKPTFAFHTTDPNVSGIVLIGKQVILRNLIITDDYDVNNDIKYGTNKPTIGNTIAVKGPNNIVETLIIEDCDFRGATSSSWVASSQTKNCRVEGCTFTGFMADHGVYCSMKVETYLVKNCQLRDITRASGVFKVRTSEKLRTFIICNIEAHNLNSYLAMLSMLETPEAEVQLDNIRVTKDADNTSVFYGFCFNDETKSLAWKGYNANKITVRNCVFEYGYEGNSFIYSGAGKRVCVREIEYDHVTANESNFGGGVTDKITVNDSHFETCSSDKGIYLATKTVDINNSILRNDKNSNCLFLVNYDQQEMQSLSLRNVEIDANTSDIVNVENGDSIYVNVINCTMVKPATRVIKAPKTMRVILNQ